jgi:CRP/FNR family transcriptional regulator, polysaccharide utilization system transcription regulator
LVIAITDPPLGAVYKRFMSSDKEVTNELYADISDGVRDELAAHEQTATFPRGTRLLQCGIPADRLVILNSGSVEISVSIAGQARSLGIEGPGKVFALDSIISGAALHTSATCLEECNVTYMPKEVFLEVLRRNPQMYFAVAKVLSSDLAAADRIIRNCARRSSAKSVAKCFRPA